MDRDQVYRAERENQCLRPYVQKEAILAKLGDCRPLDLEAFVTCSDGERDKRNGLEQESVANGDIGYRVSVGIRL